MVIFKEKDPYFCDTMKAMHVMRKDSALCDIMLKVGQQTIHAHRCVLAAGSLYFNSLFLGNFNEASMRSIDLSSVTQDNEAVETIIEFIYTGEINITEGNLDAVIKLASFFLVEQVSEFCLEFMNQSLNLKNCLRYFFYSQDYGYQARCQKTVSMVESRFHDYLIFEQASLDITPVELHFLLTHKVLQFCRVPDLLEFVLKWLLKGPTDKHFTVALDVINNVSAYTTVSSHKQRQSDLEGLYEKVAARQEVLGTDSGKTFLKNFSKVMTKMSRCCSPAVNTYNLRAHSSQLSSKQEGNTELALVAFAPRPCVVEAVDRKLTKGRFSLGIVPDTEPVFDLCVYVVSNQTWYHLQQLMDMGVPCELLYDSLGMWRVAKMRDRLTFILREYELVCFFDLRHMTWREVSYSQLETKATDGRVTIGTYEVIGVLGADQTVYLIQRIRVFDDAFAEVRQAFFRCYRLLGDDNWEFVFDTPRFNTEDEDGDITAMISSGSNEMLILHCSYDNNCVYLADMSEEKPIPVQLLMIPEAEADESFHLNVHLLERANKMYVVKDTPQRVFVMYEYKFKSRKLVPVSATPTHFIESSLATIGNHNSLMESYPCLNKYSVSDGTSLWRVVGNRQKTSHLTELRVAPNKSLVQVKHTPPPFPCVTAVFAGRLDQDIISRLEPIVRYLSP